MDAIADVDDMDDLDDDYDDGVLAEVVHGEDKRRRARKLV